MKKLQFLTFALLLSACGSAPRESQPSAVADAATSATPEASSDAVPSPVTDTPAFKIGDQALVPWATGMIKTEIMDMTSDGLFLPDFIDLYFNGSLLHPYKPVTELQTRIGTGESVLLKVGDIVLVPWATGLIRTPILDLTADGQFAVDFIDLYLKTSVIRPYRKQ